MIDDISRWIAELSAEDTATRIAAAEALCQRQDCQSAAIPLVRATGDANEQVREYATSALEDLEQPAAEEVPALAELLNHRSADVSYWAATLLGRCGPRAAAAVEALAWAVASAEAANVRQRAAWALGQIGPAARRAGPALQQAAESTDRRLARLARDALAKLQ